MKYLPELIRYNPHIKRFCDIILSAIAFILLSPVFVLTCILICIDSKGPPFFMQERIGKGMIPFRLVKFRSMTCNDQSERCQFHPGDNCRVTKVGKVLRRTKIDELPELFNILRGNMSIVGPRPEVERYTRCHALEFEEIMKLRPGLSDFASIKYRDEETLLACQADPEKCYIDLILPDKLRLAREYAQNISLKTDMRIILATVKNITAKS